MRSNILNVAVFLVVAVGFWFGLSYIDKHLIPKPPNKQEAFEKLRREQEEEQLRKEAELRERIHEGELKREQLRLATGAVAGWAAATEEPRRKMPTSREVAIGSVTGAAAVAVQPKPPTSREIAVSSVTGVAATAVEPKTSNPSVAAKPAKPKGTLIPLGDSTYNLNVMLTTTGGAVQQVILTKFNAADRLGHEVMEKAADGKDTKQGVPLYLIPGKPLYDRKGLQAEYLPPVLKAGPIDDPASLEAPSYVVYHYPAPEDKYPDPYLGEIEWKVVSREDAGEGEQKVVFEAELGEPYFVKFRKTYTLFPGDYHIGFKLEIERLPGGQKGKGILRYQLAGPHGLPLEGEWYTTTTRVALVGWDDSKGTPRRQYDDAASVATKRGGDLVAKGDNKFKYMAVATQYMASGVAIDDSAEGSAKNPWSYVRATTETLLNAQPNPNALNFEDLTIRAASDLIDLEPGKSVTHKYIIYNGPAKVRLLGLMGGDRAVDPALVERYQDKLGLRTITDFHSPSWVGSFASAIWWSDLVQVFDNLMHYLLWAIHAVIGSWGASIVVLTVLVRLLLHYPSRKQTQMSQRMVEVQKRLAPQLEELKKRYADDFNTFNREKMRLMMANGMNPASQLGGCLLLLFQTPVMMGLYFCLQESIFFRLDHFLWIGNMAAPDMTLWWSEKIPFLSTPSDMGSFFYLGPYLNILPLIAVGLMLWQQNKMMPPPTDDQMAQQQKMMKFMMIFMALMFYKVAAGLALYFIVGSVWGLIERRYFIKKAEHAHDRPITGADGSANDYSALPAGGYASGVNGQPSTEPDKPKGPFGRFREALSQRMEELKRQADEQSKRQIRNKPDQNRGDKKKRKRK